MTRRTVYLAGPMVFLPDPEGVFVRMKAICDNYGLTGLAPLDNQTDLANLPPGPELMARIVRADIELMRSADAGLFCLDGFRRGPEMDAGTAFEAGFMHALGKTLAGWTSDPRPYPAKVQAYFSDVFGLRGSITAPNATGGTSGSMRDPDGILVHSEGCLQNAMVHVGIEMSGGIVAADVDWESAFTQAVKALAGA